MSCYRKDQVLCSLLPHILLLCGLRNGQAGGCRYNALFRAGDRGYLSSLRLN